MAFLAKYFAATLTRLLLPAPTPSSSVSTPPSTDSHTRPHGLVLTTSPSPRILKARAAHPQLFTCTPRRAFSSPAHVSLSTTCDVSLVSDTSTSTSTSNGSYDYCEGDEDEDEDEEDDALLTALLSASQPVFLLQPSSKHDDKPTRTSPPRCVRLRLHTSPSIPYPADPEAEDLFSPPRPRPSPCPRFADTQFQSPTSDFADAPSETLSAPHVSSEPSPTARFEPAVPTQKGVGLGISNLTTDTPEPFTGLGLVGLSRSRPRKARGRIPFMLRKESALEHGDEERNEDEDDEEDDEERGEDEGRELSQTFLRELAATWAADPLHVRLGDVHVDADVDVDMVLGERVLTTIFEDEFGEEGDAHDAEDVGETGWDYLGSRSATGSGSGSYSYSSISSSSSASSSSSSSSSATLAHLPEDQHQTPPHSNGTCAYTQVREDALPERTMPTQAHGAEKHDYAYTPLSAGTCAHAYTQIRTQGHALRREKGRRRWTQQVQSV
ncbi:hypothetical protein H0H81_005441 [Sphagnurus paluster]|uniref:Uncharacterized protein n=1 Tax=Sphagnurus paluster TaxID=117069 RepID=A0A9P7K5J4_9AGAR|nr:hypothetical protein H0H81_005441 [Sphagnurus paluster]